MTVFLAIAALLTLLVVGWLMRALLRHHLGGRELAAWSMRAPAAISARADDD